MNKTKEFENKENSKPENDKEYPYYSCTPNYAKDNDEDE